MITESGRLRAALDVTDPEPLPADHSLWTAPGLLLTPHVAGNSRGVVERAYSVVAAESLDMRPASCRKTWYAAITDNPIQTCARVRPSMTFSANSAHRRFSCSNEMPRSSVR
ncbi:NAD(P)-dependent oxidoreductase [Nocardia sp. NBC_00565]|uniref:NAD(P)-dependent oxidoreductase n=1 Tax=Nocardia sp. NBC_00565 TaxID=2975993 RepID=UPI003FA54B14